MTINARLISVAACLLLLQGLASCATIPTSAPIAPTVILKSVKPLKIGLTKQELAFQLEITNPNSYDLPIQSLSFVAKLENKEVAQGISNERVTLPANGKAVLEIIVSARIQRILGQLLSLNSKKTNDLKYDVKGFVKLSNWPIKIPFTTDGNVSSKQGQ
ncbi:LEA type 2 family protein [Granulosicoccus sp.]|jgi:LEA14-like dessication related protein|nr:LEA type 2 family protein [Granulosicoccus sp.]MDB4222491.1 LEA type 2 family protein [Granulosicoccus sp.]